MLSKPGISGFGSTLTIPSPVITVVPTVTLISVLAANRTPVTFNSIIVGTGVAPGLGGDVTVKGSIDRASGLVTLKARALPPASLVLVKISGCAIVICTNPRSNVALFATAT